MTQYTQSAQVSQVDVASDNRINALLSEGPPFDTDDFYPVKWGGPTGTSVTVSYSFLKQALQTAGLVKKHRARGRHRRRREPRACFGELLHLDGSVHEWFALDSEARPCLRCSRNEPSTRRSRSPRPGDRRRNVRTGPRPACA